jgi:type I restriction enzyme S subunit
MCITIAANIAETAILSFPACFPDSVVGFIAEPNKAEVKFIEYMFRFMRKRIQHQATGSVQDNINLETLERLHFPLPPLAEQKAIAAVLGALDDKIELNRRTNSTLETMARALFQSWFVDFDPVRAKLDGRKSDGLDKSTAALFPSHLVHESGGVAPQGWSQRRWGDIATLEYGKSLRDYRDSAGRYRVYGTNGPIGFHDEALCENAGIIIGRKGAYRGVHYSPEPFFVIDTAFYLKPKAPIDLRWAYYELLRFDINGMDSGSAIPSTSRDDFYGIPVIVPTPEIQTAFGAIVGGWFAKTSANDRESQTLATLRDTLLPKLLSGELSAKWAIENLEATRWAKR